MNYFQVIVLSLVEGITEFLPISSTGHLILLSKLLNIPQTEFVKSFEIIIQLGAILAVVFLYFKTLINNLETWKRIFIAFIPSGIIGFLAYKFVKTVLIGNSIIVVISLFLGGIAILILEEIFNRQPKPTKSINDLNLTQSAAIGTIQAVSMIPGVSRAMATIFTGLGMGLSRTSAVEFSFLLAVPTMLAATMLDLIKTSFLFTNHEYCLLALGFLGSFISALITVKALVSFVQKHSFKLFAFYRIILALLFWLIYL